MLRSAACLLLLFLLSPSGLAQLDVEELDAVLTRYHDYGRFGGAVLVAQGDDVLYAKGFGEANMEWDIPNTPETRFRIGSVTKQFTAALILQLVEEGRLDLDGKITDYLPEYPAAQGDRVTIHHLLNHTSGIPSYTGLPGFMRDNPRDPYTPDSFLTVFSGLPLEFEPGAEWRYNNSGYFLLGAIIERVAGKPYDVALRERLLEPLGLRDTGYDHYGEIIERRASGYVRIAGGYEHAAYLDSSIPYAAGMMYSTVGDLHRWTRALHAGEVFRQPETLERMLTPGLQDYGYGIGIGDREIGERTVRVVEHSGGIFGFSTMLSYLPEEAYTIAVLDNVSGGSGPIARAATLALHGQPVPEPKRSIADTMGEIIAEDGVEAAVARYRALKADSPDAYTFAEQELNSLGYYYLQRGDTDTAIRVFQLNVEAYPDAFNPYDSLGEAYMEAGERDLAIANYQRSLELNPGNENGRMMLSRLGVEAEAPSVELPEDVLESYVGGYQLAPGFVLTISREGGQLYAQATGQPRAEIFPSAMDAFYLKVTNAQLSFHRGEDGAVESLTLHQGGRDMPAPRVE